MEFFVLAQGSRMKRNEAPVPTLDDIEDRIAFTAQVYIAQVSAEEVGSSTALPNSNRATQTG